MISLSHRNQTWKLLFLICIALLGCDKGPGQDENESLFTAIEKEDIAVVQAILSQNPHLINKQVSGQGMLLHWAVYHDSEKLLRFLLDTGADVDIEKQPYRNTPLHDAAVQGRYNIAKLLLENGAHVNQRNQFLETPLHEACSSLSATSKFVALLLSYGAEVDARAERGETPLCIASQWLQEDEEGLEIIRLLLSNGADPNINCFYEAPDLPLIQLPLARQHFKIVQLLVDHGANLELQTEEGMRSFTVEEVQELYRHLEESQQQE